MGAADGLRLWRIEPVKALAEQLPPRIGPKAEDEENEDEEDDNDYRKARLRTRRIWGVSCLVWDTTNCGGGGGGGFFTVDEPRNRGGNK